MRQLEGDCLLGYGQPARNGFPNKLREPWSPPRLLDSGMVRGLKWTTAW